MRKFWLTLSALAAVSYAAFPTLMGVGAVMSMDWLAPLAPKEAGSLHCAIEADVARMTLPGMIPFSTFQCGG